MSIGPRSDLWIKISPTQVKESLSFKDDLYMKKKSIYFKSSVNSDWRVIENTFENNFHLKFMSKCYYINESSIFSLIASKI